MKIVLEFKEKDFESMRSFEKAVQIQLGSNTYVMSDSLCLYFDYPPKLKAMLRPFPADKQLAFELESSKI